MNRSTSQLVVSIPPSSSASVQSGPEMGDLRAASGKKWSKSVDDLSKFSSLSPDSPNSPVPFLSSKIGEYRGAAPSFLPSAPPVQVGATRAPTSAGAGTVVFPNPTDQVPEQLDVNGKKHGRSLSFGRHHPSHHHTSPSTSIPIPRLPTKSIPSGKSAQSPGKNAQQMLGSLNPSIGVGANYPSCERVPSSQDKATSSTGSVNASAGYTVRSFGFPFGITHSHKPSSSPPQIVLSSALESGHPTHLSTNKASKRMSQMVMHQGFLMRLDHPAQSEKGKPFKAVLAGSKLQLYKPPGDKAAELREMFPEGLVPQGIEEEDEEPESAGGGTSPGGATIASRTKRKYWGRARHPELQINNTDDGATEVQGSLDALVHETVFGTTLDSGSRADRETFARGVLLCLPSVTTVRADFDEAFVRYLGSAFRTLGQDESGESDEERKVREKEWLEWLVGTYALLHGGLPPGVGWDEWMAGVNFQLESCLARVRGTVQAPMASPYTGVFSPRPGQGGIFETIPAGGSPRIYTSTSHAMSLAPGTAIPVNALTPETIADFFARPSKLGNTLERDRLSRDVFLRVPSGTIAKALRVLNQVFFVLAVHDAANGPTPSRFLRLPRGTDPASLFCGSDDVPHWLTRLVMTQVLSPDMVGHEFPASDTAASLSAATGMGVGVIPEGVKVSRTHTRAAVLCKWIRLGGC
jgi:hypothetical protein